MQPGIVPLINLLPWRESRQLRRRQLFCASLIAAIAMALITVAGTVTWVTVSVSDRARVNVELRSQVDLLQRRINQQNAVLAGYQKQQAEFARIRRLHAIRGQQTRMLDEMSAMTPGGLTLTGLQYDLSTVQLRGFAESARHVSQWLQLLHQRQDIANAELQALYLDPQPESPRRQDYFYHMNLQLQPPALDFMTPEDDG